MFGTQFVYGNPTTSLATDGDLRVVGLQDGSAVTSRAVVIATGVSYRRLAVPGLESLAGAGVFYGAATTQAQALAGKRAFVVGGGDSAGQAALHVSKYAQHVTILVRSTSLAASMSQYLIREIETAPKHRSPLQHRGRGRRRRWTPGAAQPPAPGHRRYRDRTGQRAVRPDRRAAIHRLAARGGRTRPMGLRPDRPGPGQTLDPATGTLPARNQHTRCVRRGRRAARLGKARGVSRRRRVDRHSPGARLPCVSACEAQGPNWPRWDAPIRQARSGAGSPPTADT